MEGLLVFLNGTVQPIGQVQDVTKYIAVLEDLVQQLRARQYEDLLKQLHSISKEDLEAELHAREQETI